MATPTNAIVYNHDIVGLYNRMNRFVEELYKSVSSNASLMNQFDQGRLASYFASLRGYVAWVVSLPQLDLPETSPRAFDLEPPPQLEMVDNDEVDDLLRLLVLSRDELINSQSARLGSGLINFDQTRITAIIDKADLFLTTYVAKITPVDLPESSPRDPMSPAGKTGA